MQLRLKLIAGRRLDEVDRPGGKVPATQGHEMARVGRPEDIARVAVVGLAISGQRAGLVVAGGGAVRRKRLLPSA